MLQRFMSAVVANPVWYVFVSIMFGIVLGSIIWGLNEKADCEARGGVYVKRMFDFSPHYLCLSPKEV